LLGIHYLVIFRLVVESIVPILDEIVSDYAGKRQAYALSIRFSFGQFGMVVTVLLVPALYNIRGSMIPPCWFMLGLVLFGLVMAIILVAIDSRGKVCAKIIFV
jgi:hypothetical protein